MALNSRALNTGILNGDDVFASGSGLLCSFTQEVAITGSGLLCDFEQEVEYLYSGEGILCSFTQQVTPTFSGLLCSFQQNVIAPNQTTFYSRNGWVPVITINNYAVPLNQIVDQITLTRTESEAAQMSFTIRPEVGNVDLDFYEGADITMSIATTRSAFPIRVFTGTVNAVDTDLIYKKIRLSCTDRRREIINQLGAPFAPGIGYYSIDAFGSPTDVADEIDKRLQTIPYAIDVHPWGYLNFTPILAKGSADYSLTSNDIYRDNGRDPVVKKQIRSKLINDITINADYRYTRLHHRERTWNWTAPWHSSPCDFLLNQYSVPLRSMIETSIKSAGWALRGNVGYTNVLASNFYNCSGVTVAYSQVSLPTATFQAQTDSSGNQITDSNGNNVYVAIPTGGGVNVGATQCFGAQWTASTQFSQNVSEHYTISVKAPQSINQYESIPQTITVGVESTYDATSWENAKTWTSNPSGAIPVSGAVSNDYYLNMDSNISGWVNGINVALHKASTDIIRAHRENEVIFNRSIWPEVDLAHTVAIDATVANSSSRVQAKGKVYKIVHTMDVQKPEANTQVTLRLSQSVGSTSSTALTIPTRPAGAPTWVGPALIPLQTHMGVTAQDSWNGYIGNKAITVPIAGQGLNHTRSTITEEFRVDTPAIDAPYRDNLDLYASQTYNVAIQNDLLTITY